MFLKLFAESLGMKKHSISAFFPVYNDAGTVELMAAKLDKILNEYAKDYEIIIVDDASPDSSGRIADELAKKNKKIKVIHHKNNLGYGGALKTGFYSCKKDLIFYTDGDAQFDVYELPKLIPFIDEYDVVNGYKIKRADKFYRKIMGNLYNLIMHILFNLKVKDVDCDFRLMHRYIFDNVKLESNSGLICTEMMKKIQDTGYTIKNIPVNHYPRVYGHSQFFRPKRILSVLIGLINQWYELVLVKRLKGLLKW